MEIETTIPNAFGQNQTVVVQADTDDTRYTFHVVDGEIKKVGWISKDHCDYGTKLISAVSDEDKEKILEAAKEVEA